MIKSSYMCSSPYDSDFYQDFSLFAEVSSAFVEDYMDNHDWQSTDWGNIPPFADMSSNSSDSENIHFEDPDDALEISDAFVSHILGDNFLGRSEIVSDFCEVDSYFTESPKRCSSSEDKKTKALNSSKRTKKPLNCLSSKLWSKMSSAEQWQTLHSLSEIVTCHMGRTEQMEIIKILDPSVNISADDTEFALDGSYLSDVKLKRIKQFIKKSKSVTPDNTHADSFCPTSFKRSSKILSRKATSSSPSRAKRRQKKEKASPFDEKTRIQQKLELHGRKEAQSGLFVYEKVIKKLSNPSEEDEDVNILE